jgi:hypothetical protein
MENFFKLTQLITPDVSIGFSQLPKNSPDLYHGVLWDFIINANLSA